jgi:hypothetical protein
MEAKDGEFIIGMVTDKDYYIMTKMQVSELLEYLKYARSLFANVSPKYEKELDKYESTFSMTVSDVFGSVEVTEPENIPSCASLMNKSAKTAAGPESAPVTFEGSRIDFAQTIPPEPTAAACS